MSRDNASRQARRQRGSALVLALVVVGSVVALGLGYLRVTTSITNRQKSGVLTTKAFYLAEAGLAESFHAVRMGRTGQVGSETEPARHGEGLLWVDATVNNHDQVRLTSTALVGTGRKTLSLIIEPVEIPLGFFSDEDLVIDQVLMVDGFDSGAGSYEGQVIGDEVVTDGVKERQHEDTANGLLYYEGNFYRYYAKDEQTNTYSYDAVVSVERLSSSPIYGASSIYEIDPNDFIGFEGDEDEYDGVLAYFAELPGPEALEEAAVGGEVLGSTTGKDGLLSSNGDVRFVSPDGEPVQVFGDVLPGPLGSVDLLGDVAITGDTTPRLSEVELPPVSVPTVTMAAPVRHDDVLPMLISPGTSGHEQIVVAADSELVLRGPATIVIGELVLEPGAWLSLDTRDGDVNLYVTEGLNLQAGSTVTTSSDLPEEVALQVGLIESGPDGAPVKLEATSQFHGTIYAPETEVEIGAEFEIYGGVVARKLEIAAGARLHFDGGEYEDSPLPTFISWRIVEIPASIRMKLGADPYQVLGIEPGAPANLSEAHDLAGVEISIDYIDQGGADRTYDGLEADFNWTQVSEVVSVARVANRTEDDYEEVGEGDIEEPVDEGDEGEPARGDVADAINDLMGITLRDYLQSKSPLNDAELAAFLDAESMSAGHTKDVLLASAPLSDAIALDVVEDLGRLDEINLKDVLLASTPLSQEALDAVIASPDISASIKSQILAAH